MSSSTAIRTLRFGHSPDADDAFMFYGFHTGAASIAGCQVEHVLEDIQTLNRRALESRRPRDHRGLGARLRASLGPLRRDARAAPRSGTGYGPVVVARVADRSGVARRAQRGGAGAHDHRRAAARHRVPDVRAGAGALRSHSRHGARKAMVEAGVIIHESQLTYADEGLVKVVDFGELWRDREACRCRSASTWCAATSGPELMRACQRRLPRQHPPRARPRGRRTRLRARLRPRARPRARPALRAHVRQRPHARPGRPRPPRARAPLRAGTSRPARSSGPQLDIV